MKRIVALIMVIMVTLTLCSCEKTSTDISNYYNDIKNYCADSFMPDLGDIGVYKDISYFSKKVEDIFPQYSMQLIVEYDEETFLKEKERLATAYTYLDKAQLDNNNYIMPVKEFSFSGFDFKVAVFDDTIFPKNFGMVGVSDESQKIAYLWAYCFDLDYICTVHEDKEKEMLEFVNYMFSLELGKSNLNVSEKGQEETDNSDFKEDYTEVDIKVLYQKFLNKEIMAIDKEGTAKVINDYLLYGNDPLEYSYTYFDMNGDGIEELCVKVYSEIIIFTVKNGEIHHWYTSGMYTSLLNNGALLYERHGGAPTHISYKYYELDKDANVAFAVTFSWWDGKTVEHGKIYPDTYLFNDEEVSKEEYDEKTKEYLSIGKDEIVWY